MIKKLFFTLLCTAVCRTISAQVVDPYVPAPENLRARTEFQDAKFGIFLHWGLYSLLGTGEWTMTNRNINYQEYAKLANAFYPHDFDAAEWVSAIKSSGAGYVCFTTRHHDGFSMWDTAQTDYDIVDATPYKQDIVKALSDECARQDIRLHLYYSLIDWYRDDCPRVRRLVHECLTEREEEVIISRYGLGGRMPRTQREVAKKLGISRSYVSRIEKRALQKLEEALGERE